ncbi:MAG: hypothetical protein ACYC61_27595 [Isosphaeraceae bacterium]
MKRHLLPAVGAILAVVLCLSAGSDRAVAQTLGGGAGSGMGIFADPFSAYYAIYLPNQQLQAMRPTPLDSVNQAMPIRQYYAQANRQGLYDPVSPYSDTMDPLHPYSSQADPHLPRAARFSRNPSGEGMAPALYFNRVSQYYPDLAGRTMRNKNANIFNGRGVRSTRGGGMMGGGMGGGGMGGGGMGMGMPGMGMF